ncbi:unnamed protein product [Amoebophrya sp. A25]|nr:unnamed protein product [Amoebophrya sp. A25]|eukprot:GSA25T00021078001.1
MDEHDMESVVPIDSLAEQEIMDSPLFPIRVEGEHNFCDNNDVTKNFCDNNDVMKNFDNEHGLQHNNTSNYSSMSMIHEQAIHQHTPTRQLDHVELERRTTPVEEQLPAAPRPHLEVGQQICFVREMVRSELAQWKREFLAKIDLLDLRASVEANEAGLLELRNEVREKVDGSHAIVANRQVCLAEQQDSWMRDCEGAVQEVCERLAIVERRSMAPTLLEALEEFEIMVGAGVEGTSTSSRDVEDISKKSNCSSSNTTTRSTGIMTEAEQEDEHQENIELKGASPRSLGPTSGQHKNTAFTGAVSRMQKVVSGVVASAFRTSEQRTAAESKAIIERVAKLEDKLEKLTSTTNAMNIKIQMLEDEEKSKKSITTAEKEKLEKQMRQLEKGLADREEAQRNQYAAFETRLKEEEAAVRSRLEDFENEVERRAEGRFKFFRTELHDQRKWLAEAGEAINSLCCKVQQQGKRTSRQNRETDERLRVEMAKHVEQIQREVQQEVAREATNKTNAEFLEVSIFEKEMKKESELLEERLTSARIETEVVLAQRLTNLEGQLAKVQDANKSAAAHHRAGDRRVLDSLRSEVAEANRLTAARLANLVQHVDTKMEDMHKRTTSRAIQASVEEMLQRSGLRQATQRLQEDHDAAEGEARALSEDVTRCEGMLTQTVRSLLILNHTIFGEHVLQNALMMTEIGKNHEGNASGPRGGKDTSTAANSCSSASSSGLSTPDEEKNGAQLLTHDDEHRTRTTTAKPSSGNKNSRQERGERSAVPPCGILVRRESDGRRAPSSTTHDQDYSRTPRDSGSGGSFIDVNEAFLDNLCTSMEKNWQRVSEKGKGKTVLDLLNKKADYTVLRLLQISQQHIESQVDRVRSEFRRVVQQNEEMSDLHLNRTRTMLHQIMMENKNRGNGISNALSEGSGGRRASTTAARIKGGSPSPPRQHVVLEHNRSSPWCSGKNSHGGVGAPASLFQNFPFTKPKGGGGPVVAGGASGGVPNELLVDGSGTMNPVVASWMQQLLLWSGKGPAATCPTQQNQTAMTNHDKGGGKKVARRSASILAKTRPSSAPGSEVVYYPPLLSNAWTQPEDFHTTGAHNDHMLGNGVETTNIHHHGAAHVYDEDYINVVDEDDVDQVLKHMPSQQQHPRPGDELQSKAHLLNLHQGRVVNGGAPARASGTTEVSSSGGYYHPEPDAAHILQPPRTTRLATTMDDAQQRQPPQPVGVLGGGNNFLRTQVQESESVCLSPPTFTGQHDRSCTSTTRNVAGTTPIFREPVQGKGLTSSSTTAGPQHHNIISASAIDGSEIVRSPYLQNINAWSAGGGAGDNVSGDCASPPMPPMLSSSLSATLDNLHRRRGQEGNTEVNSTSTGNTAATASASEAKGVILHHTPYPPGVSRFALRPKSPAPIHPSRKRGPKGMTMAQSSDGVARKGPCSN